MYLHPRAYAVSEFARQRAGIALPFPAPPEDVTGQYRHAECVETATYMIELALGVQSLLPADEVGDYLQYLVDQWHAHDPGVSYPQGASSWRDATWWLTSHDGATVDGNILAPGTDWYGELLRGLPAGCVYLVGVCNAQALPGDEAGVQCHGLTALGVDDQGRIICGDPDNAATQANMAASPYGHLVAYSKSDFVAANISSLTRVHPMSIVPAGWTDDGTTLTDPQGHKADSGFRYVILNAVQALGRTWDQADTILIEEQHRDPLEISQPGRGAGSRLVCRYTVLCWSAALPQDQAHNYGIFVAQSGADLSYMEAHVAPPPPPPPPPPALTPAQQADLDAMAALRAALG